ncbi:MAG: TatD family hydrolase, partial [Planctomycetota bacterium]
ISSSHTTAQRQSMRYIDTHAHLTFPHFEGDVEAVLDRASEAGVELIICVGTDLDSSHHAVELADLYPDRVRASVGIHPTASYGAGAEDISAIEGMLEHPRVVAVGETGLDYHHDESTPEQQKYVFRRHLELGAEWNKPVIIHSREAEEDTLEVLRQAESPLRGVRHCFEGSAEMAEKFLDLGLYISFTGLITRGGREDTKEAARAVPEDRLLVETDCPFMTPADADRDRNEPALVSHTVEALASLRGTSAESVAEATTRNARELFLLA